MPERRPLFCFVLILAQRLHGGDGWGYYKFIPVEDDFPRKIITRDVRPDETTFFLSDILEMGLENDRKERHLTGDDPLPKLYSDNGSGFASKLLAEYLSQHGIKHIFDTPYHPQSRGRLSDFCDLPTSNLFFR